MARRVLAVCLVALVAAASVPASAADPEPARAKDERRVGGYTLERILELADRNHPNIAASRAKVAQADSQLDEAYTAPFSQWKMTGGFALAPTVRGNSAFSPNTDVSLTSSLGMAWRAGIEGVIPFWTFGKITNLWDAAKANVKVAEAQVQIDRDAVRLDVRKAFFGLLLARDGIHLLADVRTNVDKAITTMQAGVAKGTTDEVELLRLQVVFLPDLNTRESEARKYINTALAGLRFYTGVDDLDVADIPLREPKHQLGNLLRYFSAAKLYRPETNMARAGVVARTAQVHLARSNLYPSLGIALSMGLSTAPEIADQINPFVTDPGNYFHYGAGLVFEWKLDFLPGAARIRFAEAQLEEVRAQERLSLGGVGAEVETAYNDVLDWKRRVEAFRAASKLAKQWYIRVQENIDVGTMEEKDLSEPARWYALHRFSTLNAIMELNMAMSRLAKTTGWDAIAPDGT